MVQRHASTANRSTSKLTFLYFIRSAPAKFVRFIGLESLPRINPGFYCSIEISDARDRRALTGVREAMAEQARAALRAVVLPVSGAKRT